MKTNCQYDLIIKYLKTNKKLVPALMVGKAIGKGFAGSEFTRRCRDLRQWGILDSYREILPTGRKDKFVTFVLIK